MVTNSGGGYLRWLDFDVTRWRADTTCDVPGAVCYVRDLERESGLEHDPSAGANAEVALHLDFHARQGGVPAHHRTVRNFHGDRRFRRKTTPKCGAMTLVNISRKSAGWKLTSYLELALAPHKADRAHPAFNKLFIETEWLPHCEALLARRRPRRLDEKPIWVAHLMVPEASSIEPTRSSMKPTARASSAGAARSKIPSALTGGLTKSVGAVLDPIFSLRRRVTIQPNERFQFAIVTVMADTREAVIGLAERYSEFRACDARFRDCLDPRPARDAPAPHSPERGPTFPTARRARSLPAGAIAPAAGPSRRRGEGQRALWAQGISGDLPIVVVMIAHLARH